jgi:membrane protein
MKYPIATNFKFFDQLRELSSVLLILIYSFKFGRLLPYGLSWGGLFTDWESEILSLLPLFAYMSVLILFSYCILKLYFSRSKVQFLFTVLFSFSSMIFSLQMACIFAILSACFALILFVYSKKRKNDSLCFLILNLVIYSFTVLIIYLFRNYIFQNLIAINQLIYIIIISLSSFISTAMCAVIMISLILFANEKIENTLNGEVELSTPDYLKDFFSKLMKSTLRIAISFLVLVIVFIVLGLMTSCTNKQYLITRDAGNINTGDYIATTVVVAESKDFYCVRPGIICIDENENLRLSISSKSFRWIPKANIDVYNGTFASVAIE